MTIDIYIKYRVFFPLYVYVDDAKIIQWLLLIQNLDWNSYTYSKPP